MLTNGYDNLGRRTRVFINPKGSNITHTYAYDAASRLSNVTDGVFSAAYSYLANSPLVSQITHRSNSVTRMTTTKSYDYLNRLRSISSAPATSSAYTNTYQTNLGSLLVPKAAQTFWHDHDGNLLSDGVWTNVWNGENRLVSTTNTTSVPCGVRTNETWTFDAGGRWVQRIVSGSNGSAFVATYTNRYVWDGNVLLAILDHTNGLVMAFQRGLDLSGSPQGAGGAGGIVAVTIRTNGVHFCAYDGNGNVIGLINAVDGVVSGAYEYDPFGNTLRLTGVAAGANPMRFSSQYAAEVTGSSKYLYRDYHASLGRWIGPDPALDHSFSRAFTNTVINTVINASDSGSEFAYVANNPLSYSDHLGLISVCAEAINAGIWPEGAGGTVVCKDGVKHACIRTTPTTNPGIDYCIGEHERRHFKDTTCPPCGLAIAAFIDPNKVNEYECSAYVVSYQCMIREKPFRCNPLPRGPARDACNAEFDRWILDQQSKISQLCP